MDERAVFDHFHEALELEPRPGAYERFRADFMKPSVVAKRRPVFRMRFSRMSLRIVAAVAVVAIAIALVAGFLATHQSPTGSIPAAQDKQVKAYQDMMASDYNAFASATSNHCGAIDDQGCADAVAHLLPSMQKWVGDMTAFKTPAGLVVLDGRLRAHITQGMVELKAMVAAQRSHDPAGFALAMNAGSYERAWIDPASFTLDGTYPEAAASYRTAISGARQSLNSCVDSSPIPAALACANLYGHELCTGSTVQACASDIQGAETQLQNFLIAVAQHPAPRSLSNDDRQFQTALAQADDALLALVNAQLTDDSEKASAAEVSYASFVESAAAAARTLFSA